MDPVLVAYEAWKKNTDQANRRALREALKKAGIHIEGHGVVAAARKYALSLT